MKHFMANCPQGGLMKKVETNPETQEKYITMLFSKFKAMGTMRNLALLDEYDYIILTGMNMPVPLQVRKAKIVFG